MLKKWRRKGEPYVYKKNDELQNIKGCFYDVWPINHKSLRRIDEAKWTLEVRKPKHPTPKTTTLREHTREWQMTADVRIQGFRCVSLAEAAYQDNVYGTLRSTEGVYVFFLGSLIKVIIPV